MEALTRRELQVADLIHQGFIEKEIADRLFLSPGTIHTYKKRLFSKLNARNIADITRIYIIDLKRPSTIMVMFFALSLQVISMFVETSEMRKPATTKLSACIGKIAQKVIKSARTFKWHPISD
jgi:DNA-binding CsgD family transcriptional regulator